MKTFTSMTGQTTILQTYTTWQDFLQRALTQPMSELLAPLRILRWGMKDGVNHYVHAAGCTRAFLLSGCRGDSL